MRLDKFLEAQKIGSRGQVKKLIKNQEILVDGQVASSGRQNVDPGLQAITLGDHLLVGQGHHYYILNKPNGHVCARSDAQHPTVLDCLADHDRWPDLYPIGRLDRDTEGLVLLTDNGPLGFRMLHPKHHVTKTYYVEVNGCLGDDAPEFFRSGVRFLDGTVCKAAALELLSSSPNLSSAQVTISEGKFHQVKKMFLAYGLKVTFLKRISFADFHLGDLAVGQYRTLSQSEISLLKSYLD